MKETVNGNKYHKDFQQIPLIVYVQININKSSKALTFISYSANHSAV